MSYVLILNACCLNINRILISQFFLNVLSLQVSKQVSKKYRCYFALVKIGENYILFIYCIYCIYL